MSSPQSTQELLDTIAYVAWHGISVREQREGWVQVVLPARDDLVNYVGTGHAGALYTLAETAGGVAADSLAQTLNAFILLRQASVKYTRRAVGELLATGEVDEHSSVTAKAQFADEGRADLVVRVVIHDTESKPVFEGSFDYALRPRKV
ncbi:MAG: DUF4442 domain-containing protein [Halieaceae bacterium]|jgi:uncharacterized protein (TIGR00369 family)|nr:DUF4442 domain-containing protein [Halieaceae bacterium]